MDVIDELNQTGTATKEKCKSIIKSKAFRFIATAFLIMIILLSAFINKDYFMYSELQEFYFDGTNFSNPIVAGADTDIIFEATDKSLRAIQTRFVLPESEQFISQEITLSVSDAKGNAVQKWTHTVTVDNASQYQSFAVSSGKKLLTGELYTLKISTLEQDPALAVRLLMGSMNESPIRGWAWNGEQQPDLPEIYIMYSPYHFYSDNILVFAGLILGLALVCLLPTFQKMRTRTIYQTVLFFFFPLCSVWIVELLALNDNRLTWKALLWNYLVLLCFSFIVLAIANRLWIATLGASLFSMLGGVINHYLLLIRNTTLLPTDIQGVRTATTVMGNYSYEIDFSIFACIIYIVLILCATLRNKDKLLKTWRLRIASAGLAVAFMGGIWAGSSNPGVWGLRIDLWRQNTGAQLNGFFGNFMFNLPTLKKIKPDGYNSKSLPSNLSASEPLTSETILPTVILIANESLADLSFLGDPFLDSDPLPFLHSLQYDSNAYYGKAVMPVFGGATSVSEFEIQTQISMALQNSSGAPFAQLMRKDAPALGWYFDSLGYEVTGLHPQPDFNWDRNIGWPRIGIKNSYFDVDLTDNYEMENLRHFTSDYSLYESMLQIYNKQNKSNPQFLFCLTMQNHGGYFVEDYETTVHIDGAKGYYSDVEQYASLIKASDEAFQMLIDSFAEADEPVLIVMLGDHLPGLDGEYYNEVRETSPDNAINRTPLIDYQTPVVMWNNFGADFSNIPEYFSSNYLGLLIKEVAGLPLTTFDQQMQLLMDKYPVISTAGNLTADGELIQREDLLQDPLVNTYEQLIYNALIDKSGPQWDLFLPAA